MPAKYLIDANLPQRLALWHHPSYELLADTDVLGVSASDEDIWRYAKEHQLTIVTKDADFSDWIMLTDPPPRVIWLRVGNLKLKALRQFLTEQFNRAWAVDY